MRKLLIIITLLFFAKSYLFSQIEHVNITHPVYDFLLRAETKGLLKHFSLSQLPLQRKEILSALSEINSQISTLSIDEQSVLTNFLKEFGLKAKQNAVVFYSETDTNQVLSSEIFNDIEKFIYHYQDSLKSANVVPLGSLESIIKISNNVNDKVIFGNLGVRFFGSINNNFGYYLQATNGMILSGNKKIALEDSKLAQNVKFVWLDSDFDFSESHVRYDNDWFYATIGRENRLWGAGLNQRIIVSTNAPPMDGVSLGAKLSNFEYRFSYFGLLGYHDSIHYAGINADIPTKTLVMHRFAVRPEWGEIGFSESIIYSNRIFDPAYLNPLSFFKSLEHALRDRDNALMGLDLTLRPFKSFQLKGSFMLDDIRFEKIGEGYWSNKYASNIALFYSSPFNIDIAAEYSRIEPYTFSHFNYQNSLTNDSLLFAGYLQPNSDETSILIQFWYGNRYPIKLKLSYLRHGKNILDANGNIIRNVGGDVYNTINWIRDSQVVTFLDGNRENIFSASLNFGWEFIRGFHIDGYYKIRLINDKPENIIRLSIKFEDF